MDQVSMQLYAQEKIASARAQADLQRELDRLKRAKNVKTGPSSKPPGSFQGLFTVLVYRLHQTILLIPGLK